jgi:hypothetical protein
MANPGSFGDLGKEAKETLLRGKDFVSKPHIEIVTTSSNNVKSTAKITREDSGSLLGSIELKFPKTNGVESSVTLDSANKLKATVSLADKIASGLKASLTTEIDATKNEKVFKGGYEYKVPPPYQSVYCIRHVYLYSLLVCELQAIVSFVSASIRDPLHPRDVTFTLFVFDHSI